MSIFQLPVLPDLHMYGDPLISLEGSYLPHTELISLPEKAFQDQKHRIDTHIHFLASTYYNRTFPTVFWLCWQFTRESSPTWSILRNDGGPAAIQCVFLHPNNSRIRYRCDYHTVSYR